MSKDTTDGINIRYTINHYPFLLFLFLNMKTLLDSSFLVHVRCKTICKYTTVHRHILIHKQVKQI